MSLRSFQEALAEIISSPRIGQAYHKDPALLDQKYSLSDKEKNRLLAMIRQEGMRTNYMLYQMNRLTPLSMFMPYTLKIIRPDLMNILHQFWTAYPKTSFQFVDELAYFHNFLQEKLASGVLSLPYLENVLRLEEAINHIRFDTETTAGANDEFYTLHPFARVVYLDHDAHLLASAMVTYDATQPDPEVPEAPGYYVLHYEGRLKSYPLEAAAAIALLEKRPIEDVPEELVELGVLI